MTKAALWSVTLFAAGMATAATAAEPTQPMGNPVAGKSKSSQCAGCHEIAGYRVAFPQVYRVPKLAGQHADYIAAALKAYQTGERTNTVMAAIAANLNEQDMRDLGAYYAGGKRGPSK
jgi:cytochrome c553